MKKLPDSLFKHPHLVVAPCRFGHGVFAVDTIPAETTVEECPYLRIRQEDCQGVIDDYVFGLDPEGEEEEESSECYSLPLGWGCLLNHANDPNIEYWHDTDRDLIVFYTTREIAPGEQLFIDYGDAWWETRDIVPERISQSRK